MSLENSMEKLAASNERLAASLDKYADTVERYGLKLDAENVGKVKVGDDTKPAKETKPEKETAAQKKAREKAEAAAKVKEDDGFGDEEDEDEDEDEVPSELNADIIKAKLFEVKDAYGDKAVALKVIQDLGYTAIPDVKAKDYEKVYRACLVALKKAP